MVFLFLDLCIYLVFKLFCDNNINNSIPLLSDPMTEQIIGVAPNSFIFKATLAAPPNLFISKFAAGPTVVSQRSLTGAQQ